MGSSLRGEDGHHHDEQAERQEAAAPGERGRHPGHEAGDVLDRIDEIVPPGVTVNPADNSYGDHELRLEQRRR